MSDEQFPLTRILRTVDFSLRLLISAQVLILPKEKPKNEGESGLLQPPSFLVKGWDTTKDLVLPPRSAGTNGKVEIDIVMKAGCMTDVGFTAKVSMENIYSHKRQLWSV